MKKTIYFFAVLSLGIYSTVKSTESAPAEIPELPPQYLDLYTRTFTKSDKGKKAILSIPNAEESIKKILFSKKVDSTANETFLISLLELLFKKDSEESSKNAKLLLQFLLECVSADFFRYKTNAFMIFFKKFTKKNIPDFIRLLTSRPALNNLLRNEQDNNLGELSRILFEKTVYTDTDSVLVKFWMDSYIKDIMESKSSSNIVSLFNGTLVVNTTNAHISFLFRNKFNDYIKAYICNSIQEPYSTIIKKIVSDGINPIDLLKILKPLKILFSNANQVDKEAAFKLFDKESQQLFCKIYMEEISTRNVNGDTTESSYIENFLNEFKSTNPNQSDQIMETLLDELCKSIYPAVNIDMTRIIDILQSSNFATKYPARFKKIAQLSFDRIIRISNEYGLSQIQIQKNLTQLETIFRQVASIKNPENTGVRTWLQEYFNLSKIRAKIRTLGKTSSQKYDVCIELARSLQAPSKLSATPVCSDIGNILKTIPNDALSSEKIDSLIRTLEGVDNVSSDIISNTITNRLSGRMRHTFFLSTLSWKTSITDTEDLPLKTPSSDPYTPPIIIPDSETRIAATSSPIIAKTTSSYYTSTSDQQSSEEQGHDQEKQEREEAAKKIAAEKLAAEKLAAEKGSAERHG